MATDPTLAALAGVWTVTTAVTTAIGLTDPERGRVEASTIRLAGTFAFLGGSFVAVPAAVVLGFRALVPFTTIRGRTLGPLTDEFVAAVLVAVGGYFAWLGYTDRLFESEPDGESISLDGQRRIWVALGAAVSASALVTALV